MSHDDLTISRTHDKEESSLKTGPLGLVDW